MSAEKKGKDLFESLTGFDEIAIAQRFGDTVTNLASANPTMFGRALVFVEKRRSGANDEDAWKAAMEMPLKEVDEFASPAEDAAEDAGDSGKDEEPELLPATSPSSVF